MKNIKVLVVDTDEMLLEFCRAGLEVKRYKVVTARNIDFAMESYIHEHPSILVVEMELPNHGSHTLFEFVRNHDSGRYLPFIFTCSEPTYEALKNRPALEEDPLVKPFLIDKLDFTIRSKIKRFGEIMDQLQRDNLLDNA